MGLLFGMIREVVLPIDVWFSETGATGWLITSNRFRAISSVWLEYYLDMVGVTGSSPVSPNFLPHVHLFAAAVMMHMG